MTTIFVNLGKIVQNNRFAKETPDYTPIKYMVASADSTTPNATDSVLLKPLPSSSTTIDACDATTGWSNSGDAGSVVLNTTAGEFKEGTGALNLPTTFSSGTATWQKTVTSFDGTSRFVYVFYYVSAKATYLTNATDAVQLVLGTGGTTNSDYYNVDYNSISDGWNLLVFDIENGSSGQNGSGMTLTGIDTFAITAKNKASVSSNNQRLDWIHYANESSQLISLETGYPQLNESSLRITYRFFVGSNAMNGYDIKKIYLLNDDATKKMCIEADVTTISKTSKQRISFIVVVAQT